MRHSRLALAALVAGLAAGCGLGGKPGGPPPMDKGAPIVTAAVPVVKTVTHFNEATGTFKARKRVEIRPQVSGTIKQVHFVDGAEVKAGDLLVTIDPSLYSADLKKAEADVLSAQASARQAVADEKRIAELRAKGSASQDEYDRAAAQKGTTEATIAGAKATADRARQNLEWTRVVAPIDGRVDRILVNEGNVVSGGGMTSATVLTIITSTDPIYAYFDIDEETVRYYNRLINAGKFTPVAERRVPIELQLSGEEGYPHKGELDFAAPELNPTAGSRQVRAEVKNPKPWKFIPGLFVKARIPGAVVENAVLIPDTAVAVDQNRKVVYVVTPEDKVSVRPVTLGPMSDGLRVIAAGLNAGERVILRGMQRVQEGVPVEVQPGEIKATDARSEPAPAVPTPAVAPK